MGCNASIAEDVSPNKEPGIIEAEDFPPNDEPGIIGYVMEKEEDRILVISPEAQDFSSTGGISEYYNAIWFANAPKDINIGEKVKVWYEYTLDSYPAQSEVIHIEVIPAQQHEGANLTEEEALYRALTSELIAADGLVVVKAIEYDKENGKWDVELKEIWSDTIHNIEIEDK